MQQTVLTAINSGLPGTTHNTFLYGLQDVALCQLICKQVVPADPGFWTAKKSMRCSTKVGLSVIRSHPCRA
ncbi:hypothetical protein AAHC03_01576 [Spirometra sp. Aus1]